MQRFVCGLGEGLSYATRIDPQRYWFSRVGPAPDLESTIHSGWENAAPAAHGLCRASAVADVSGGVRAARKLRRRFFLVETLINREDRPSSQTYNASAGLQTGNSSGKFEGGCTLFCECQEI